MNKFLRLTVTPLMFLLFLAGTGYGQNFTVQGKITDSRTGDVLVGVNVVVQGTLTGSISLSHRHRLNLIQNYYRIQVTKERISDFRLVWECLGSAVGFHCELNQLMTQQRLF